ncbi:kinesin-like protein KIF18A [Euwallacea similis]|uniref:kinesin-like protein KIF18A n=1 Tax=Euwallacea similis TaxID=1736056 RepID=UPI00344F4C59
MLSHKLNRTPNMVKSKNEPLTSRRKVSMVKNGVVNRISKALTRPLSNKSVPAYNIKVIVRVRPPNNKELQENYHNVVKVIDNQTLIFDPKQSDDPFFYHGVEQKRRDLLKKANKDITFNFDRIFSNISTNMEVFMNSTKSLIETLMEGCNCSVFAYGATGAGKTFTMIGNSEHPGITYLTMKELFDRKEELSAERDFKLMATYIEVYNELVKDLLNAGASLNLREDAKYGVMIQGVKGHNIHNPDQLFELLEQGNKRRTQHPTDSNEESSRSHAVFQVYIQMTSKATKEVSRAKLSMIDLAGSERGSATGFAGARFKEGANINKSLLALGNCINSLADGHRHVPYRDSKLTRLLKDSLGGNCFTIMIANVSPSSMSFEDTYNTLKYATRAKKIKSSLKRNVINVDMNVDHCIQMMENLQTENSALKMENAGLKQENEQLRTELLRARNAPQDAVEPQPPTQLSPSTPLRAASTNIVESENSKLLKELVAEKKELMEREFHLQSCQLGITLRREQKMGYEARLSVLYVDTPTKDEARRKLKEQVQRYEKRELCTKMEIDENRKKQQMVDERIKDLMEAHVDLSGEWKECETEMKCLTLTYERDLAFREKTIVLDAYRNHASLVENMAEFMTPLFMAVGGADEAPERIKRQHKELVAAYEGKKGLRWPDEENLPEFDSGLSSLTSVHGGENTRPAKRKIKTDNQTSFDSTFTLQNSAQTKVHNGPSTSATVAKGFKSPANRMPKMSPRKRIQVRTSPRQQFRPASVRTIANSKKGAPKAMPERPRFRM